MLGLGSMHVIVVYMFLLAGFATLVEWMLPNWGKATFVIGFFVMVWLHTDYAERQFRHWRRSRRR